MTARVISACQTISDLMVSDVNRLRHNGVDTAIFKLMACIYYFAISFIAF